MHSLISLRKRIDRAFAESAFMHEPAALYEPIAYTLDQGGKRLRPVLVLLSCDLFGGDIEKAVFPAMGIEIFHNFTLLHDDIMDNAPLRRGFETVHKKWSANTAILSGDTMFVIAYEHVAKTDPLFLPRVLDLFNDTARKVCEGQQYDMAFETKPDVTVPDYLHMIRLKTAVLIACGLKLGAILADAGITDASRIYEFGVELGMAFQLRDDYLDAFGDTGKFGKEIGGDIATNKKTYLYLKAFELATGHTRIRLTNLFAGTEMPLEQKTSGILQIYRELEIDRITRTAIERYHHNALRILDSFGFESARSGELISLMNDMLVREK
jgi:geranylgeranyl diphosphate synthase, type II